MSAPPEAAQPHTAPPPSPIPPTTSPLPPPSPTGAGLGLRALDLRAAHRGLFGRHRRTILRGLSLDVRPGECVGLLGPNGAGKTTTFRILAGLRAAQGGVVTLGGQDLTGWPLWRRARAGLGYLPQGASIFRRLTVLQNVEIALDRWPRAHRRERALALLEAHGLTALRDALGRHLSGGERRRVEIVRALAAQPRVLLVDEPLAGLDPLSIQGVLQTLRDLTAGGVGVLLSDHQAHHCLEVCDRIYILSEGRCLFSGPPAQVRAHPEVQRRYLGVASPNLSGTSSEPSAHSKRIFGS